ncbi:MAG: Dabb family protein [Ruminococcaceae bacterium]|nr:Dabb family protein [Oscillospiraceae bacterium]
MVKHIILWNLKEEFNTANVKEEMKRQLEGLVGVVPGLLKMKIEIDPMPSSNVDVMLYSELESADALKGYASHPDHVRVADTYVRPYTKTRTVIDFEDTV